MEMSCGFLSHFSIGFQQYMYRRFWCRYRISLPFIKGGKVFYGVYIKEIIKSLLNWFKKYLCAGSPLGNRIFLYCKINLTLK